jgi:mRNA interferase MazF
MKPVFLRGQVFWTRLDPVVGHEQAKTRPCAVVSDNAINQRRGTVVIVPLTSTPQPEQLPLIVALPSMGVRTKARTEQLRSVDKTRLGRLEGVLSGEDMEKLGSAIAKVLRLG